MLNYKHKSLNNGGGGDKMSVTFIFDARRMTTNVIRFWRDENNARKSTLICRIQPYQHARLYSAPKRVATRDEGEDPAKLYVATELEYVYNRVLNRRYSIVYKGKGGDSVFWGSERDPNGEAWRKEQGLTDEDVQKMEAERDRLNSLWQKTLARELLTGFDHGGHNGNDLISLIRELMQMAESQIEDSQNDCKVEES